MKRYLQKVSENIFSSRNLSVFFFLKIHEYHSIVDRWRLRRHIHDYLPASDDVLFQFFDINHDHVISPVEFTRRLEIRPQQHQSENNQ